MKSASDSLFLEFGSLQRSGIVKGDRINLLKNECHE